MVSKQELDNSLEYLRSRGLSVDGTAWYVFSKKFLGTDIPRPEEIIAFWNNNQQADGRWLMEEHSDMFTTHHVLLGYYLLNSQPQKSLDPFMSNYATYQDALDYITAHDFRNIYHVVFGWALWYWKYPSWLNDVFAYIEQDLDWTTGTDYHKTTHTLYNYVLARRQFPNLDGIINTALALQQADGSWPPMFNRPFYSTSIMITMLAQIAQLYPNHRSIEIQNALNKAKLWVVSQYHTTVVNGYTLGYFGDVSRISDSMFSGVTSAGQTGLIDTNVDMTFSDIVQKLQASYIDRYPDTGTRFVSLACSSDTDCPSGQVCQNGVCATPPPSPPWALILIAFGVAVGLYLYSKQRD